MRTSLDRVDGWHVVVLTRAETDRFFDKYDPHDKDMPSYLHHVGHRYIREFIYNWLVENFGPPEDRVWFISTHNDVAEGGRIRAISFENPNHAMLFVTIWAGKPLGETT